MQLAHLLTIIDILILSTAVHIVLDYQKRRQSFEIENLGSSFNRNIYIRQASEKAGRPRNIELLDRS